MTRYMLLITCVLTCALLAVPASADDPPKKLTAEERKELETRLEDLNLSGLQSWQAGKYSDAHQAWGDALALARRLYPKDEFPKGHAAVVRGQNAVAIVLMSQAKYADAEPLIREALHAAKQLFEDGHPAQGFLLNNLGSVLHLQGKLAEAEPVIREAVALRKKAYKGDHPDLAQSLNNLGLLLKDRGDLAAAQDLFAQTLDMHKRLVKGDDPNLALALHNLATVLHDRGSLREAKPLFRDALAMRKRLYPKLDHQDVAQSLNNLAALLQDEGELVGAEEGYRAALAVYKTVHRGDHLDVVTGLNNLAFQLQAQGKGADARPHYRDALNMSHRITAAFARQKAEGEALTWTASLPQYRDGFLSNEREGRLDPSPVYAEVWADKGTVSRVYEQRQQAARAVATDPRAAALLAQLIDARRRRAELILGPGLKDPHAIKRREEEVTGLEVKITDLDRTIRPLLPPIARVERLTNAPPAELQRGLAADAAVVDLVRYKCFEYDKDRPVGRKKQWTERYLAFVVTRDKVAWVDLDTAANIEPAVTTWCDAITGGKEIPPALPAKVRELVWEKVRKELPAGVKTVYVCPDAALCRVPWGALPGDKPGTILLEDFAVATIPHAPFLLDKLWPQDPLKNPPAGALVVGGVKYDAELAPPAPTAVASRSGDPLVKPGAKLGWSFLPGTAAEATGVFGAATAKKLPVTALKDDQATAPAVLAALPKAKYAHFATHGFFADPSFRGLFQLDEKDYEKSLRGERIGRAANSPLVMTGLVFAGANNPKTPGRGIVTGESLIDLDLSGLELAVLSACETGLGDVAGGEGTFGLQRAFHYAGTRDVVASLWKVPDQSTAALMALFYRNLWDKNLSPMEALRQAQLAIYRDPDAIPELAKGFRGKFEEVPGAAGAEVKPLKDGKAHPLLWAAFTLSGPGR